MTGMKKLHIDSAFKVRLTEAGKQVYQDWHEKYVKVEPAVTVDPVDEDGFAMFDLLTFMSIFGECLAAGVPEVIEGDFIFIDDGALQEV